MSELLRNAAGRAARYLEGLAERPVHAAPSAVARLESLREPLPDGPTPPDVVLEILDEVGSPATVASAGPRYFGFVTGGTLPAALAAQVLAGAWDQNAALAATSPVGALVEEIAEAWLVEILGLPERTAAGLVTGATAANFTALTAARHALLARAGWDVEAQGMFGAPPVRVVAGEEVHASVVKAVGLAGLGRGRIERVPADGEGRLRAEALPTLDARTIVCVQAGNVNSGACDPFRPVCEAAAEAGAWVHVDGAFGLWAAAAPTRAALCDGVTLADSWAVDCHKWLNVSYDSGVALVRDRVALEAAMAATADYLPTAGRREPAYRAPEFSRRARGVEIWAALKSLGRRGVADLVERCCRHAQRLAEGLAAAGHQVLNEVVLNQVVVAFGDEARTRRVIAGVQAEGTCWCGPTTWQGRAAMRISVSSWATTEADVARSLEAILRVARDPAAFAP